MMLIFAPEVVSVKKKQAMASLRYGMGTQGQFQVSLGNSASLSS